MNNFNLNDWEKKYQYSPKKESFTDYVIGNFDYKYYNLSISEPETYVAYLSIKFNLINVTLYVKSPRALNWAGKFMLLMQQLNEYKINDNELNNNENIAFANMSDLVNILTDIKYNIEVIDNQIFINF